MLCTFWRCLRSRPGRAAAFKTALFRCVIALNSCDCCLYLCFGLRGCMCSVVVFCIHPVR